MRKLTTFLILISFILGCVMPPQGLAQGMTASVQPGLSAAFTPAMLQGMTVDPNDPFKFDFIVHRGNTPLTEDQKQAEYIRLIKYFLTSLAVAEDEQWVNLSPYEQDRMIPETFGRTEMGRDLLSQDYLLKQISASLTNPDTDLGKKFWDSVYAQAYEKFGTTDIPTDTFNKVWIMPDSAVIHEQGNTAVIIEHHLKVMMDADRVAADQRAQRVGGGTSPQSDVTQDVMREVIIPAIEKEVNEGRNFAPLRQVYSGMLLAVWYKMALKESILGKLYADKGKVAGVDQDPANNQKIYEQYVSTFKQGVFNMIKEEVDVPTQKTVARKYFSGGMVGDSAQNVVVRSDADSAARADAAMNTADIVSTRVVSDAAETTADAAVGEGLVPKDMWEVFYRQLELKSGWTVRLGGRPYSELRQEALDSITALIKVWALNNDRLKPTGNELKQAIAELLRLNGSHEVAEYRQASKAWSLLSEEWRNLLIRLIQMYQSDEDGRYFEEDVGLAQSFNPVDTSRDFSFPVNFSHERLARLDAKDPSRKLRADLLDKVMTALVASLAREDYRRRLSPVYEAALQKVAEYGPRGLRRQDPLLWEELVEDRRRSALINGYFARDAGTLADMPEVIKTALLGACHRQFRKAELDVLIKPVLDHIERAVVDFYDGPDPLYLGPQFWTVLMTDPHYRQALDAYAGFFRLKNNEAIIWQEPWSRSTFRDILLETGGEYRKSFMEQVTLAEIDEPKELATVLRQAIADVVDRYLNRIIAIENVDLPVGKAIVPAAAEVLAQEMAAEEQFIRELKRLMFQKLPAPEEIEEVLTELALEYLGKPGKAVVSGSSYTSMDILGPLHPLQARHRAQVVYLRLRHDDLRPELRISLKTIPGLEPVVVRLRELGFSLEKFTELVMNVLTHPRLSIDQVLASKRRADIAGASDKEKDDLVERMLKMVFNQTRTFKTIDRLRDEIGKVLMPAPIPQHKVLRMGQGIDDGLDSLFHGRASLLPVSAYQKSWDDLAKLAGRSFAIRIAGIEKQDVGDFMGDLKEMMRQGSTDPRSIALRQELLGDAFFDDFGLFEGLSDGDRQDEQQFRLDRIYHQTYTFFKERGDDMTELSDKAEIVKGGIDLNVSALDLQIKRDGNGIVLPADQQDLESIRIDGLVPVILNIRPAVPSRVL